MLTRQPGDPGRLNQPTASLLRVDQARAGAMATCRASKVVWSRHIAKRIPANRRARATVAMREPRRLASRSAHARKPAASARRDPMGFVRRTPHAGLLEGPGLAT